MRAVETVDAMKRERRIPAGCGELVYPRLILEGRLERAASWRHVYFWRNWSHAV